MMMCVLKEKYAARFLRQGCIQQQEKINQGYLMTLATDTFSMISSSPGFAL